MYLMRCELSDRAHINSDVAEERR